MKNISRVRSLRQELEFLLEEVCVGLGCCSGSPDQLERILSRRRYTADEFVGDILEKEGLIPEHDKHLARAVREKFIRRFGVDDVCASDIENDAT